MDGNTIKCVVFLLAFISEEAAAGDDGFKPDGTYRSSRRDRSSVTDTSCDTDGKEWSVGKTRILSVKSEILNRVKSAAHCKALCINIQTYDVHNKKCVGWNYKEERFGPFAILRSAQTENKPSGFGVASAVASLAALELAAFVANGFRDELTCELYSEVSDVRIPIYGVKSIRVKPTLKDPTASTQLLKTIVGKRQLCERDVRIMIKETAASHWEKLLVCQNDIRNQKPLTCTFKQRTGITRTRSTSSQNTDTSSSGGFNNWSAELEASLSGSGGIPLFGEAETTLTTRAGASGGFDWSSSQSLQRTVAASTSESSFVEKTLTYTAEPGEKVAICQPVGEIGTFEIRPAHICSRANGSCEGCT